MIQSLKEAVEYFILQKRLQGAKDIIKGRFVNGARGPICQAISIDEHDYMIFFKREWFYMFGTIYGKSKPIGQSFSIRAINDTIAYLNKAVLAVVMPNQEILYCKVLDAAEYIEYENTVRTPSTETEEEGSIPSSMLSLLDPNDEPKQLPEGQTTL